MRKPLFRSSPFVLMFSAGLLAGCNTTSQRSVYPDEEFTSTNIYTHSFPGSGKATCEAARRALLSQGYIINDAGPVSVKGSKNFQPESEVHMQVAFNVTCAPDSKGSNSTTVFANAVRDRYSLKKSPNSASLGVSVLGSVSLPIGGSDDSLVKVASETIPSKEFYEGFFALVLRYLDASPESVIPEADVPVAKAPTKE